MPRHVNEKEFAQKRSEILDAALRLIYSKGYEQMSVQDILNMLHISKGAFYHYFTSKQSLLEALIDRMVEEGKDILTAIAQNPNQTAVEKFHNYFDTALRWKNANIAALKPLFRVWYNDDNAIVRDKMLTAGIEWLTPLYVEVIQQGIAEGVFHTSYPDQVGQVVMSLLQLFADSMARLLLKESPPQDILEQLEGTIAVYSDALERVLGAPAGSLHLLNIDQLSGWLGSTGQMVETPVHDAARAL